VTAKRGEAGGLRTAGPFRLTPREIECLEWLGRGLRVGGIGSRLGIGVPTVATHLSGARKKLGAATREQALVLALRLGLIDP
jgi:DNA-binding CsgD family transcriptional regulator